MSIDEQSHVGLGSEQEEQALQELLQFPFVDALFGRRSRRFFRGAEVPDGPVAFKSRHEPLPLTELEKLLILTAVGGNTGWHHAITRHDRYAPHLSNYAGAAGGRTFPSAAGFHTSEIFLPTIVEHIFSRRATCPPWSHAKLTALSRSSNSSRLTDRLYTRSPISASTFHAVSRIWKAIIPGLPTALVHY